MPILCEPPLWIEGHVSNCILNNYISNIIPLSTCLVSFVLLVLFSIYVRRSTNIGYRFEPTATTTEDALVAECQDLNAIIITTTSRRMMVLESLILLVDIAICFSLTVYGNHTGSFAALCSSAYLLLLLLVRNWSLTRHPTTYNCLWIHSTILYVVLWLCTLLTAHSAFVDPGGATMTWRISTFAHLGFFAVLCLIHLTAPGLPVQQLSENDKFVSCYGRDEAASLLSRLTYFWVDDLVWIAFYGTLETSDLYGLNHDQTSAVVVSRFHAAAAAAIPLLWRLYQFFKYDVLKQGVWAAVHSVVVFMPAMLIRFMLEYLEDPNLMTSSTAWLCVGGLLVSGIATSAAECQCEWVGIKIGSKLRSILISEIYGKVLRKSVTRPTTKSSQDSDTEPSLEIHASDGNIFNLMSADTEFISFIGANLHFVWVSFPVQTTIATYLLYRLLGPSGIIGVGIMIALLPLNVLLSRRLSAAQKQALKASDARIQSSNELLQNIHTIKYLAWELPFKERVLEKRRVELERMRSRFVWWSINMTVFYSLPFIVTILTFFFYVIVWGNRLGTLTAFPALVLFSVLRIPLDRMADSISFLLQAHVSVLRVDKFLKERETGKYSQLAPNKDSRIGFENATFIWPTSNIPSASASVNANTPPALSFQLQNLEVEFRENALNVICGPSGSGKSSILLALLGEMEILSGHVSLHNSQSGSPNNWEYLSSTSAYCSQEPWIFNQSIRENILFGVPFNADRYNSVLSAVSLRQDLASLDDGDNTLAGEKGNKLSGGQKQRVALARALYSHAKYILLDDCLSAVDARTANHMFFRALKGPLMHNRTCILATHHVQLAVPNSDFVLLLEGGRVTGKGTPAELVEAGLSGGRVMEGFEENRGTLPLTSAASAAEFDPISSLDDVDSGSFQEPEIVEGDSHVKSGTNPAYTEAKAEGAVAWPVLRYYLSAMGPYWYWTIVILSFASQQLISLGTNLWIKKWASQYDYLASKASSFPTVILLQQSLNIRSKLEVDSGYYLAIYALLCLVFAIVTLCRNAVTFTGALKASSRIYSQLLGSILGARLLFFDQVPLGQITNRFQTDVGVVDQSLAPFSINTFQLLFSIEMVIILISVVLPAFVFVAVLVCASYYCIMSIYINSSRDLKRIEAVQKSPLYQLFSETLSGCTTIRAYGLTSAFINSNQKLIDRFNEPYILLWAAKEWLTFRVGFLSAVISGMTGAFVLWKQGAISPGAAGLVLTYAVTLTEQVIWLVQIYAAVQQSFNSVDRIAEYTSIPQEASTPPKPSSHDLPDEWPERGHIKFQDYTTSYSADLEPVLKGVSFEVTAGKRVGIVGRTGAGKSTLTLALIRLLEAEKGAIFIDNVDIASVSLQRLRKVVTIVPQDPTLFDGSLRDNLDPLHLYTDDNLLDCLCTVRLSEGVDFRGEGPVLDRAANTLSQGQRQLLCIARALLRRSRILVLDEATASIDHTADALIQAGLQASVDAGTTVLTIAHRLLTIADYDFVIVMDEGRIVESGGVKELLEKKGVFASLCEESGDIEGILRAADAV